MTIVWSQVAADELDAAVEHIAAQNPNAAFKVADGVLKLVERLHDEPMDGPEHVLRTGEVVRGWPYPPFRIYYQRQGEALLVVRVFHQKREPIAR